MSKLSPDARAILGALPPDGTMVGNISLMRRLRMKPGRFFAAKAELAGQEQIKTGKGRGGSTGRAKPVKTPRVLSPGVKDEFELYDPLKTFFDDYWKPDL